VESAEMQTEVIALLYPESNPTVGGPTPTVTALVRDAQGFMELRRLKPDHALLRRAKVAGRFNCGKPIVDPRTREVIGCEIEPIAVPAR
jgi:hypothetical protein